MPREFKTLGLAPWTPVAAQGNNPNLCGETRKPYHVGALTCQLVAGHRDIPRQHLKRHAAQVKMRLGGAILWIKWNAKGE